MSIKKLFLISTFFIFTGLYVQDVIAQESSESRLEEVVVTAQKKSKVFQRFLFQFKLFRQKELLILVFLHGKK
jgi:hypothetical protein